MPSIPRRQRTIRTPHHRKKIPPWKQLIGGICLSTARHPPQSGRRLLTAKPVSTGFSRQRLAGHFNALNTPPPTDHSNAPSPEKNTAMETIDWWDLSLHRQAPSAIRPPSSHCQTCFNRILASAVSGAFQCPQYPAANGPFERPIAGKKYRHGNN